MNPGFIPPVANPEYKRSFPIKWILLGTVILALVLIAMTFFSSLSRGSLTDMYRLNARLNALQSIIDAGNDSDVSATKNLVGEANILLKGDTAAINLATMRSGATGKDRAVVAAEDVSKVIEGFATAKTEGHFEATYLEALKNKLESTMALLETVNKSAKSKALRSATSAAYEHCAYILDQLVTLTSS